MRHVCLFIFSFFFSKCCFIFRERIHFIIKIHPFNWGNSVSYYEEISWIKFNHEQICCYSRFNWSFVSVLLHIIHLTSELISSPVEVRVVRRLPMKGTSTLLGNDSAGERVMPLPKIVFEPVTSGDTKRIKEENPSIFPSCTVIRAQARKKNYRKIDEKSIDRSVDEAVDVAQIFMNRDIELNYSPDSLTNGNSDNIVAMDIPLSRRLLVTEQERDPELTHFSVACYLKMRWESPNGVFCKE